MLNLIRRFFFNRSRRIFRFWDGRRIRWADPVQCWREILADGEFDIERDTALMELPDAKTANAAWVKCVAAVRRVFNVAPVESGGLMENECVDLFKSFCVYLHALKKNSSPLPTKSPTPTGPPISSGIPLGPRDGPDSISIPTASDFAPPQSWQTG
jgi:hypothetical protein